MRGNSQNNINYNVQGGFSSLIISESIHGINKYASFSILHVLPQIEKDKVVGSIQETLETRSGGRYPIETKDTIFDSV